MTVLHEYNPSGIRRFRASMVALRADPAGPPPSPDMLEAPDLAEPLEPRIELERPGFRTKRDAAAYLLGALEGLNQGRLVRHAGVWTWLSHFYLDDLCPETSGRRRALRDYYYVYEPENGRHGYRHLLAIAYRFGLIAPHCRLLLDSPLHPLGRVADIVAGQLKLLRIPCIFEVLDRLYWDDTRGRPKAGITDEHRPGDLRHRLPLRIRQLQKTYDLYSIGADDLLELLGAEFRPWLEGTPSRPPADANGTAPRS